MQYSYYQSHDVVLTLPDSGSWIRWLKYVVYSSVCDSSPTSMTPARALWCPPTLLHSGHRWTALHVGLGLLGSWSPSYDPSAWFLREREYHVLAYSIFRLMHTCSIYFVSSSSSDGKSLTVQLNSSRQLWSEAWLGLVFYSSLEMRISPATPHPLRTSTAAFSQEPDFSRISNSHATGPQDIHKTASVRVQHLCSFEHLWPQYCHWPQCCDDLLKPSGV